MHLTSALVIHPIIHLKPATLSSLLRLHWMRHMADTRDITIPKFLIAGWQASSILKRQLINGHTYFILYEGHVAPAYDIAIPVIVDCRIAGAVDLVPLTQSLAMLLTFEQLF